MTKTIRVLRILEYVGPEDWVRHTLAKSSVKGTYIIGNDRWISSVVLGEVHVVMAPAEAAPQINGLDVAQIEALRTFYLNRTGLEPATLDADGILAGVKLP